MAEQEYGRIDIVKSGESAEVYTATVPNVLTQYIESESQSLIPTVVANSGIYAMHLTWNRDDEEDKEAFDKFSKDVKYIASHPNVRASLDVGEATTVDINSRSRFDGYAIHTALVYYNASSYVFFIKYGFWVYDDSIVVKMFAERITEV